MPKAITPYLWFDTQAEEAAEYYCSIFPDSRIVEVLRTPGTETVLTVDFELQGQRFTGLNGGPEFNFTEAVSFMVSAPTRPSSTTTGSASPTAARRGRAAGARTATGSRGRSSRPAWTSCSATRTASAPAARSRRCTACTSSTSRRCAPRPTASRSRAARPPRRVLGGLELAVDDRQPEVPEARVGEVDADDLAELLGRAGPAGAQQLEVGGHERLALLLVAAVDRERQQLAVGVRVDVARRADEVRDVGPPRAVVVRQLDRVAEQLALRLAATARRSARRPARPPRGAPCARGARSGSSRPGGTRWRPRRRRPRSAAPGASRASRPARAAGRRRSARRTRSRSRRASAACSCGRRPGARRARRARRGRARARASSRRGACTCS